MATSRRYLSWHVAIAIALVGACAVSAPDGEAVHRVSAQIQLNTWAFPAREKLQIRVLVSNASARSIFVLRESWGGPIWIDRVARRIVIAHYAYTMAREKELRGGWTSGERYRPEFYRLLPGEERVLLWDVGSELSPGAWKLEGKISILADIATFSGREGGHVADEIAAVDELVPISPTEITIDDP